ncbi:chemotaxis protein CheW [Allosphingosinicella vermicomposti]|uniref:chemotaxis protein CheW n=1 Tax=Allosphingosinicella vermicomposti TaxID=614671 RepID=UPI000D107C6D|nr:chemotaxis protein CheW [Allosphingosinicella vermicomposti]
MAGLYLIVDIDGERIAVTASDVESVVELDTLTPVPGSAPHILGLSALRSRVLSVIDCRTAIGLPPAKEPRREAMVVNIGGHPYALLVDRVEDVVESAGEPAPATTLPSPNWAEVSRGMIEVGENIFLLVDPAAIIEGPSRRAA